VVETNLVHSLGRFNKSVVYGVNYLMGVSLMTEQRGRMSQLWVAAGAKKSELVNGAFYRPVGVLSNNQLDKLAKSEKFAKELWEWTEKALEPF